MNLPHLPPSLPSDDPVRRKYDDDLRRALETRDARIVALENAIVEITAAIVANNALLASHTTTLADHETRITTLEGP